MSDFKKPRAEPIRPVTAAFTGVDTRSAAGPFGAAARMVNYRVVGGELVRRPGYRPHCRFTDTVRALWYGHLPGVPDALYAVAGCSLEKRAADGTVSVIGSLSPDMSGRAALFSFYGSLYVLDGAGLYVCDGSTVTAVTPYVPLVRYQKGVYGVENEYRNRLTDRVRLQFTPNESNIYFLGRDYVSLVSVTYRGLPLAPTDYTVDTTGGVTVTVTRETDPDLENTLEFVASYDGAAGRSELLSCRCALSDARESDPKVFFFGGTSAERIFYTGLVDGVPTPAYCPVPYVMSAGDGRWPVTSIVREYDHLTVFTEHETWYALAVAENDPSSGLVRRFFNTHILNGTVGGVGTENVRMIENTPFSVMPEGVYRWTDSRYAGGERKVDYLSGPVAEELDSAYLRGCLTFDCRSLGELWLAFGDTVWVWNYRLGMWYSYDNIEADGFCDLDAVPAFWCGQDVYVIDPDCQTDDGDPIGAEYESVWYGFDRPEFARSMRRVFAVGQNGTFEVTVRSDGGDEESFLAETTAPDLPQVIRHPLTLEHFSYLKLKLTHQSGDPRIGRISVSAVEEGERQ